MIPTVHLLRNTECKHNFSVLHSQGTFQQNQQIRNCYKFNPTATTLHSIRVKILNTTEKRKTYGVKKWCPWERAKKLLLAFVNFISTQQLYASMNQKYTSFPRVIPSVMCSIHKWCKENGISIHK